PVRNGPCLKPSGTSKVRSIPPRKANRVLHGRLAYLVVNDVTVRTDGKNGKARRLPKRGVASKGRAHVSIIAFILIRVTRRSRRADPRQIAEKWARRLPALLNQELSGSAIKF
ncbi:hypothetical protein, partial [Sphingobium sp. AM]|uniref:hypothetical protein n=1 Tax=Sphingobium sp. AM TaxID=1176302 RepID=UPI001EDA1071